MSQQPRAPSATHLRWQDVGLCQCPCIEPIPSRFHSNSTRVVLRCRCYPHAPCCLYKAPTGWHCLTAVQYKHLCGSVKSEHLEKVCDTAGQQQKQGMGTMGLQQCQNEVTDWRLCRTNTSEWRSPEKTHASAKV
jgi:hypothetical protein